MKNQGNTMNSIFNVNVCYLKNFIKNTYNTEDFKVRFKRVEAKDLYIPKNNKLYYSLFLDSKNRNDYLMTKYKDTTLSINQNTCFFTHLLSYTKENFVFDLIEIEFKNDVFDFKELIYKPSSFSTHMTYNKRSYNYKVGNYITSDVIGKKIGGDGKELPSTFYDKAEIYANAVDMDTATLTNNTSNSILSYGRLTLKGDCTLDFGGAVFSENQSSISILMEVEALTLNPVFYLKIKDLNNDYLSPVSWNYSAVLGNLFYAKYENINLNKSFKSLQFEYVSGSFQINKIMITPTNYNVGYFTNFMKY